MNPCTICFHARFFRAACIKCTLLVQPILFTSAFFATYMVHTPCISTHSHIHPVGESEPVQKPSPEQLARMDQSF
jgi:hypothetical protein